jgi:hypothetical protein
LVNAREAEIIYLRQQNELELAKARKLADIETNKFKDMVDAIGSSTLQAIATAGPDLQVGQMAHWGNLCFDWGLFITLLVRSCSRKLKCS